MEMSDRTQEIIEGQSKKRGERKVKQRGYLCL